MVDRRHVHAKRGIEPSYPVVDRFLKVIRSREACDRVQRLVVFSRQALFHGLRNVTDGANERDLILECPSMSYVSDVISKIQIIANGPLPRPLLGTAERTVISMRSGRHRVLASRMTSGELLDDLLLTLVL